MRAIPIVLIVCLLISGVMISGCLTDNTIRAVAPEVDNRVYTQGYTGAVEGSIMYDVMIVDNVDTQFVLDALQYVPNWIEFTIVPIDTEQYVIETEGRFIGSHIPTRDNLIVVYDFEEHEHEDVAGAAYIGYGNGHRISISVIDGDTAFDLGMRIYHEVLHTVEIGGEADTMNTNSGFVVYRYLDIFEQYKFYGYLMCKYRGDLV